MQRFFRRHAEPVGVEAVRHIAKPVAGVQRQMYGVEFDMGNGMEQSGASIRRGDIPARQLTGMDQPGSEGTPRLVEELRVPMISPRPVQDDLTLLPALPQLLRARHFVGDRIAAKQLLGAPEQIGRAQDTSPRSVRGSSRGWLIEASAPQSSGAGPSPR